METKNYGLLKPAQNDFYDVDVFNANMDKIDNELKKRSTAMENVSDSEVEFVAAEVRENIKSGETLRIIFGKLAKLFADLKKVAFTGNYKDLSDKPSMGNAAAYGVANNDTTTEEGFVADARIVKTHGDEIDVINSNLTADGTPFRFGKDSDGNYGYIITGEDGADSVIPFNSMLNDIYYHAYGYMNWGLDNTTDYHILKELTPGTYTFFIAWSLTGFSHQILDGVVTIKCGAKTIYTSAPLDTSALNMVWTGTAIVVSDIEESGSLSISVTRYDNKNCTVNVFAVKS